MWTILFAGVHILTLAVGFAAVVARGRAFARRDLSAAFEADNWWGLAAVLWLVTGLARAFGGLDKGTAYYLANSMFHAKMGLFVAVLLLEAWPMVTLIRWRIAKARGAAIDTTPMGTFVWINHLETAAVLLMPLAAVAMARGVGM